MRPGWLLLGVFLLAAPLRAETVIRAVPVLDVKILDPYLNTGYGTRNHGHMIYETLFSWDSHLQPQPQMVGATQTSADQLTWTFTLRPGLAWSDGTPVTSADCIASLDKWMRKDGFGQKLLAVLDHMQANGPASFSIILKSPFPLMLTALGKPSGYAAFILPERIARLPDGSPQFEPIGSGPFIFRKDLWQPGNRNIYERNPAYKPRSEPPDGFAGGHVVHVDRVEWITMADPNTALNALLAGEVDLLESAGFDSVRQLQDEPSISVTQSNALGSQTYLRPNSLLPPFNNEKARQALLYLDDKNLYGMAESGDRDFYLPCPALFMCGSPLDTDAGAVTPDLARARQLLQESGYHGEKIVMMEPTNTPQFDAATLVTAAQLRKIGATVELQPIDYNIMMTRRSKREPVDQGGWNLFVSGSYGIDVASPMTNIYLAATCDQAAPGWPCDPEIEALKSRFLTATSEADRRDIARQIQLRAMQTVPYVNLVQLHAYTATRHSIIGFLPSPIALYWNVEKKP